jgi:hypothetical protein
MINTVTKLFFSLLLFLTLSACGQTNKTPGFEKIIYYTSMCFGTCPTYHLEVNADKSFKLFAEQVFKTNGVSPYEPDSAKMGYFKGTLSDSLYDALSKELKRINIDSLSFPDVLCCDGPVTTLIIYHHGKRKYLHSMFPPEATRALISVLYNICKGNMQEEPENLISKPKTNPEIMRILRGFNINKQKEQTGTQPRRG